VTDNPILREEEMGRWDISTPRPVPKADTRLVFIDGRGKVFAPVQPITIGEAVWGNLRRMYEIDVAEHAASFESRLPCREKGFYFEVDIHLSWRIHDPAQIVADRRTDVGQIYRGYLTEALLEYSENYGLEQRVEAERALKAGLGVAAALPQGLTITSCRMGLSLGPEAEEHLANRTRAGFAVETGGLEHEAKLIQFERDQAALARQHEVDTLRGQHRGEHQKRQFEHEAEIAKLRRAMEIEQQEHERLLASDRAQHELQLEKQRLTHDLELSAQRREMYQQALDQGQLGLLLLFLDKHPEDVGQLINLLRSDRHEIDQNSMRVLEGMLHAGLLDGPAMDETGRQALQNLLRGLRLDALDSLGLKGASPLGHASETAVGELTEGKTATSAVAPEPTDEEGGL
jgi:hypothetical protein